MFSPGSAPPPPSPPSGPIRPFRDGLLVGLAVLAVSLLSIAFLQRAAKDAVKLEMRSDLIRCAEVTSALIESDSMKSLLAHGDEGSPAYVQGIGRLRRVLEKSPSIRYLYTMRQDGDTLRFVLDASPQGIDPGTGIQQHSRLGEAYPSATPSMLETLRNGFATSEEEPVTDKWGSFLSGYAPLRDRNGAIVGLMGVDMRPEGFLQHQEILTWRGLFAQGIMVLFSLLTGFLVWQSQDRRRQEQERQEAQERLLLSEEKYRMLFETAGTAIVVFGPDRTVRMINRICEELYGWSRSEIEGKMPWTHFVYPEDLPTVLGHAGRRAEDFESAPRQYDCRLVHRCGELRHVTFSLAQIPGSDLLVCSLMDRTSLVTAWQELEESRRRYQVIFEVTDTPMLAIDETNHIRLANDSCLKLLNRTRSEIEHHTWEEFVHPDDLPALVAFETTNTGTPGPWRTTQRILTSDGITRHLSFVITRLPGTTWRIAAGLDLTERIEAETAMRTMNARLDQLVKARTEELETALRSREDFLSSMSHELRTPLQAIEASTEMLLENRQTHPVDDDQVRHIRTIQRSAGHLLTLISDILDLAKSLAGHLQLRTMAVDVQTTCQEALDLVGPAAVRRGVATRFACALEQPSIQADPVRLKQMLVNVLGNAVKFTPTGGEIVLEVLADATHLHLVVSDTGIGIDAADQQRLFQPFVQLDNSLARIHAGTGLGLALVQRLAQAHGGTVSLHSKPSEGTTVTITLPWEGQSTSPLDLDDSTVSDLALPTRRSDAPLVLLAEDNLDIRECVCEYLEALGYRTVTASNGLEALERAAEETPAIVLMDVQMPYMDGLEATRRLRRAPATRETPIVAMTALAQASDVQRCMEAGSTSYLAKPVRLKDLASAVNALCDPGSNRIS